MPVKIIEEDFDPEKLSANELSKLGISKNKVLTRNDKLKIFEFKNKQKIHKLIFDGFDRKIFFNYIQSLE